MDRRSVLGSMAAAGAAAMTAGSSTSLFAAPPRRFFERIGKPVGLQLYMLGDEIGRDLDRVFAQVAAIGYREIELARLLGRSAADIRAAADRAGLRITTMHLPAGRKAMPGSFMLDSSNQLIADTFGTLGVSQAIVPMFALPDDLSPLPGEPFAQALMRAIRAQGADFWKRTAGLLNERAAALRPLGISLGYHNHNVEFAPVGKTDGWTIIADETDRRLVSFEVDLGWVAAAGHDVVAFLKRMRGRVGWVHVKDLQASTVVNNAFGIVPAVIGAGKLDWARILPAADEAGARHYFVEQEPPFSMPRIEAAARSYAFLSRLRA